MKEYIEERAVAIANYIIDHNATVRQTAKRFGISKSTVHKDDGVIIGTVKGSAKKALILVGSEPVWGRNRLNIMTGGT